MNHSSRIAKVLGVQPDDLDHLVLAADCGGLDQAARLTAAWDSDFGDTPAHALDYIDVGRWASDNIDTEDDTPSRAYYYDGPTDTLYMTP